MRTWCLTFPITVSANRLHLLDHPRSQLSDHNAHTAPSAGRTLLDSTRLPALAAVGNMRSATHQNSPIAVSSDGGTAQAALYTTEGTDWLILTRTWLSSHIWTAVIRKSTASGTQAARNGDKKTTWGPFEMGGLIKATFPKTHFQKCRGTHFLRMNQ